MYCNCLLHVFGDRQNEVAEWLDYHLALGFDSVYVYDSGNRPWLDGLCERYGDKVRLMPRVTDGWKKTREILGDHLSKRKTAEWCVALSDNEFVWIDLRQCRNIKDYINAAAMRNGGRAITGFYVYMSCKGAMPNRVGSSIDCFLHTRENPQGVKSPHASTGFGGVTFFLYDRVGLQPLAGSIQPTCREWRDANGGLLTPAMVAQVQKDGFDPSRYAMRIYRYAVRSDKEMGYKPGERPTGYTRLDMSMQLARQALLNVPSSQETEEMFTKPADFNEAEFAAKEGPARTDNIFDTNLPGLPITKAKIDQLILEGNYLEDVIDYITARGHEFDYEQLVIAFNRERQTIADSSPVYRQVQTLMDQGKSAKEISKITNIAEPTLDRMAATLRVLDIRTGVLSDQVVAEAVNAFETAEEQAMSAKEIAQNDARFAEVNRKRADAQKKSRLARAAKKAGKSVPIQDEAEGEPIEILGNGETGALDKALDELGLSDEMPDPAAIAEIEKANPVEEKPAPVTVVITPEQAVAEIGDETPAAVDEKPETAPKTTPKKGKK